MTGPGQDLMVEKVMEWQADRSATRAVIDVVHASELLAMLPRCCPRDALTLRRLSLTAIGCVVLVMDKARQIYGQSATYPTLRTRLLSVILAAVAHGMERGREYFPRAGPSAMLSHWMQAVSLSLLDIRVAAHVLQADSDLPDYKLGVEAMPYLYDTALLEDADFQAAWTAVTLLAQGDVTDRQREQHLRDMTDSSALDLLHASSVLSGRKYVTYPGPGIRALTASFDRWWDELRLIIEPHDNHVYDLLDPYRTALVTSTGGTRSSALAGLVGQLRAAGVDAGYWDDAEHRRVRMGAGSVVLELAIGFGAAVAGGAAWEGIKFALEKATGPHDRIKATMLRERRGPDGVVTSDWFEYRGRPEAFITALSKVVGPDEQPSERRPHIRPIGRKRR